MFLTRILPFLVILLTVISIGFFIAASGDFIHLYEIDQGEWATVISTSFSSALFWAVPAALVIVVTIWIISSWTASRISGKTFKKALELDALSYLPLIFGLLIPLRYSPGVAKFSAGLYLLCSTLTGPLLFLGFLLMFFAKYRLFRPSEEGTGNQEIFKPLTEKTFGLGIFAAVFVFYIVAVPIFMNNSAFGGDQPHYLIVSHSLVEDGDIYIKDDHDAGAWKQFTDIHIEPQFFVRTTDGRIIPFHRIGLPLLTAIPYMLMGKLGALLLLGLFAAISSMNIYWLCNKIVGNRKASLWATLWVSFTAPALLLSFLMFTENVSILVTLIALNLIIRKDERELPKLWWLVPLVIWTLPWMHAKDLVTAIAISAFLLFRLKSAPLKLAIAAILCLLFSFGIPLFNFFFYGSFSPVAEMGADQGMAFSLMNAINGLGGILLDQEFGILLYNPALLVALIGMVPLFFRNAQVTAWLVIIMGFSLGPAMLFRMWWGGGSPPARYAVAIFHLLAIPLAALLADVNWKKLRPVFYILFACGVVISGVLLIHNHLLVDDRDGSAKLLTSVSIGHLDAAEWWPSWIFDFQRSWPLAGILILWAAVTITILIFLKKLWRSMLWAGRASIPAGIFFAMLFCLASFLAYTGIAESMTPGEPNGYNPTSHELDKAFHQRFRDGDFQFISLDNRQICFPARRFSSELLFGKNNLTADEKASRGRSKPFASNGIVVTIQDSEPFWAGSYEAELGLRSDSGGAVVTARIKPSGSGNSSKAFTVSQDFQSFKLPFSMSNNSANIVLELQADNPSRFSYIILRPASLTTRKDWLKGWQTFNLPFWRYGSLHIAAETGTIFKPEGDAFWTVGDSSSRITFVSKEKVDKLNLVLRSRPDIVFNLDGRKYQFSKKKREFRISLQPEWQKDENDQWYYEISTATFGKFVPANYNKNSTDTRTLGVQIALE